MYKVERTMVVDLSFKGGSVQTICSVIAVEHYVDNLTLVLPGARKMVVPLVNLLYYEMIQDAAAKGEEEA